MIPIFRIFIRYLPFQYKRLLIFSFLVSIFCGITEIAALSSIIPFLEVLQSSETTSISGNLIQNFLLETFNINTNKIMIAALVFAVSSIFSSTLRVISFWFNYRINSKIGSFLSNEIYNGFLSKDYEYHVNQNTNRFLTIISNHLDTTVKGFNHFLQFFTSLVISIFIVCFIIIATPKLSFIIFLVFCIYYAFIVLIFKRKLFLNSKRINEINQYRLQLTRNSIGGIRDIIINETNAFYSKIFQKNDKIFREKQVVNSLISFFPKNVLEALTITTLSIFAVNLYNSGNLKSLTLIGGAAYAIQRLLPSVQAIYASWSGLRGQQSSIMEIEKELENIPKQKKFKNKNLKKSFKKFKKIKLVKVSYSYSKENRKIFSDFNVEINRGDCIGIIGKTGSGKSTFVDILMGLLKPSEGNFYIDEEQINNEFSDYYLSSWRKCISHVPQEIFLRNETIISNIQDHDYKLSPYFNKKLEKALRVSKVNEFIPLLSNGLETYVGERGARLSGGQKQRIAIAKALLKDKVFLVLDEGTSSLDKITEREIIKNIKEEYPSLTIIMITHNLANLDYCDRIFEVSKGKIKDLRKST